ncbi:MAG: NAD(P)-dependent oxidoreductase [Planctomycetota bacterium]
MQSISDIHQLDELLSRPSAEVQRGLSALDGELVLVGAGGKLGPSLARMAQRARGGGVTAVSRFPDARLRDKLQATGVRTLALDLSRAGSEESLPEAAAVMFLAGTKFGTSRAPAETWAVNAWLSARVASRYAGVPTVVFSSGNVYPMVPVDGPGANESTPPAPMGEYAWSVLARERVFEHYASMSGTPLVLLRINYAVELRYGVLLDLALAVRDGRPVDLSAGYVNLMWQGDTNRGALRALQLCGSPPRVLNLTGTERLSVRDLATRLGACLGREPVFTGVEQPTALLSDASLAAAACGPVEVPTSRLIEWVAEWVARDAPTFGKPTHFEVRDGAF